MSLRFIKFEHLPPFKQLINWISFGMKTSELSNYDIKYGWSLHNTLSLIIVMLIWLGIGLIVLCTWFRRIKKSSHKCGKWISKYQYVIVFSPIIRLYLESFLFFAISPIEEIRHFDFNTYPKLISYCMAWVLLSLCFVIFVASIYKWQVYIGTETSIPDEDMFCELFSGLKSTSAARFHIIWFMGKRLLFVAVVILLYNTTIILKIVILLCIQIADTIFIFLAKPWKLTRHNIIEFINQLFLLIIISCLLKINKKVDWSDAIADTFIYCLLIHSNISLLIILSGSIYDLIKWCNKKNNKKEVWTKKPRGYYVYKANRSNRTITEEAKSTTNQTINRKFDKALNPKVSYI